MTADVLIESVKIDAVVIGGGFYGASIAIYLAKKKKLKKIILIEKESELLSRASYNNQARVHNGYHYPRSYTTAYRSRINLPKFVHDWPAAVKKDFTKLYAIARKKSKVSAKQFTRFCKQIGAQVEKAEPKFQMLFNILLIEEIFLTEEYAFDSTILAKEAIAELQAFDIEVRLNSKVTSIEKYDQIHTKIELNSMGSLSEYITTRVFNCTYSGLNQIHGELSKTNSEMKHEITEMALVNMPKVLDNLGVTVMDGPFFSIMPFPAKNLHTVSHVRYTPHMQWNDEQGLDPYEKLNNYDKVSRYNRMSRDIQRYIPEIQHAKYTGSMFEIKSILKKNEIDDGRPILFKKHLELPSCYSILGGKIDNIFDVFEKLDQEAF